MDVHPLSARALGNEHRFTTYSGTHSVTNWDLR